MVNTPLFDPTVGAFRVKMDENGTNPTNTYTTADNAWVLYSMLDYDSFSDDALALTTNVWAYLNSTLFVDDPNVFGPGTTNPGYSGPMGPIGYIFVPQNGTTSLSNVNVSLNLLGALANSYAARRPTFAGAGSPVNLQALNISQLAFNTVNDSSHNVFKSLASGDQRFRGFTDSYTNQDRSLETNALGIACLSDFYIQSGRQNATELAQAQEIYNFIANYLWNGTMQGYMDQVDNTGTGTTNRVSLAGNAYWLLALAKLFEASGNLTYYQKAIQDYNQTINNLWDSTNYGFNTSISCYGNDSTKSVGDNCFFYFALRMLDQASSSTQLVVSVSPANLVAFQYTTHNVSSQYNMTWFPSDEYNIAYTINNPIAGANVTFNLYYPNGTFLDQFVNYTNANGAFNGAFSLPARLPSGIYTLKTSANLTGYGTAVAGTLFTPFLTIYINGDQDFASQVAANSWAGDGTLSHPYIIANLNLGTIAPGTSAIEIRNTDIYFIIQNCTLFAAGISSGSNYPSGLQLNNVTNGQIDNNTSSFNTNDGFDLESVSKITLVSNTAFNNSQDGFNLGSNSINNVLTNNTATNNTNDGFELDSACNNNTLTNNTASSNAQYGFYLTYSNNNTLTNNTAASNAQFGFILEVSSNNTLMNNAASSNAQYGFYLTYSDNNTLTNNTAAFNAQFGFFLYASSNITLASNAAFDNNQDGFNLEFCNSNNILTNNTATNNANDGFNLESDSNITLASNFAFNNGQDGFYLTSSNNNTLSNNFAVSNTINGFFFTVSNYNNISINVCTGNPTGIWIQSSSYNLIAGNDARGNSIHSIWDVLSPNNIILLQVAGFSASSLTVKVGQSVTFTDATIGGNLPLLYYWSFGDGTGNSTFQNPTHQFDIAGINTVTLSVVDFNGDYSVFQLTITVIGGVVTFDSNGVPQAVPANMETTLYCTAGGSTWMAVTLNTTRSVVVTLTYSTTNPAAVGLSNAEGFFEIQCNDTSAVNFPITVKFYYNPTTVKNLGLNAAVLTVYCLNPATNAWETVTGTVNITDHSITVQLTHMSTFAIASTVTSFPIVLIIIFVVGAVTAVVVVAVVVVQKKKKQSLPVSRPPHEGQHAA